MIYGFLVASTAKINDLFPMLLGYTTRCHFFKKKIMNELVWHFEVMFIVYRNVIVGLDRSATDRREMWRHE